MGVIKSNLRSNLTTDEFSMISYYIDRADEAYDSGNGSMLRAILEDAKNVLKANRAFEAVSKIDYLYAGLLLN